MHTRLVTPINTNMPMVTGKNSPCCQCESERFRLSCSAYPLLWQGQRKRM